MPATYFAQQHCLCSNVLQQSYLFTQRTKWHMIQSLWTEVATTRQYHSKYYLITVVLRCENDGASNQSPSPSWMQLAQRCHSPWYSCPSRIPRNLARNSLLVTGQNGSRGVNISTTQSDSAQTYNLYVYRLIPYIGNHSRNKTFVTCRLLQHSRENVREFSVSV